MGRRIVYVGFRISGIINGGNGMESKDTWKALTTARECSTCEYSIISNTLGNYTLCGHPFIAGTPPLNAKNDVCDKWKLNHGKH